MTESILESALLTRSFFVGKKLSSKCIFEKFSTSRLLRYIKMYYIVSIQRKNMTEKRDDSSQMSMSITLITLSFTYMMLTAPSSILALGWNYFG